MTVVLPLDSIQAADAARVGGKALGCARLRRTGAPVPDGIVLLADGAGTPEENAALQAWLGGLSERARLAVRSSAADEDGAGHSFAGIYETRLNVAPHAVAEAIAVCRASAQSTRAAAYRKARGTPLEPGDMAVLVQAMIQPRVSGVAFTSDPISGAPDRIVVNSCWGLGDALLSGQVEPDEFHVRKSDGAVLSSRLGDKRYRAVAVDGETRLVELADAQRGAPTLNAELLRELAALLMRVERAFGAPQDVEWAHDGVQFWLLQSRPVTSKPVAGGEIEWTRANAREVLPDVTSPQAMDLFCGYLEHAFRAFGGRIFAPEAVLGPIAKAFYGRLYLNLSQLRHMCRMLMTPAAVILRGAGHAAEITADDERTLRPHLREFVLALPAVLGVAAAGATAGRSIRSLIARVSQVARDLDTRDPTPLSDGDIVSVLDTVSVILGEQLAVVLKLVGVTSYEGALERLCRRIGYSPARLLQTHLASGEPSVTTQQAFDLLALAGRAQDEPAVARYFAAADASFAAYRATLAGTAFLDAFDGFLARYGHRGAYETDWALPRYREDPTPLLAAIRANLAVPARLSSPAAIMAEHERAAAAAWADFVDHSRGRRRPVRPLVRWLLGRTKLFRLWREGARFEVVRLLAAWRRWHLALADRWVERGWIGARDDYFLLTLAEVRAAVGDPAASSVLPQTAARRRVEQSAWRAIEMPLLFRERELPTVLHRARRLPLQSDATRLSGLCVSAGCVEGEVAVLSGPGDFAAMKPGAILVAPATDPSWTPLFTLAAGVIVEIGGTLSHASTVAREYGLPAVANVRNATRILRSGDRVRLDATNGVVELLSRPPD